MKCLRVYCIMYHSDDETKYVYSLFNRSLILDYTKVENFVHDILINYIHTNKLYVIQVS